MKDDWKKYLEHTCGAVIENGAVLHFGNPARELQVAKTGPILMDLSNFGLIGVRGEDAQSFLQNMTCNDVRNISETSSQINALVNPKGRILANFRLFKRLDTYYLQLPHDQKEAVLKRLQMYVLRAKVEIIDSSESFIRIGCTGPDITRLAQAAVRELPPKPNDALHHDNLTVLHIPGLHPRYEILGKLEDIKKVWERLNVHAAPVGSHIWRLHNIWAGIPTIYAATSEAFVPQMANFKEIGALSFTKGCYPGQEVVARSQYLGKLKRRMYLGHAETDTLPRPGDSVFGTHTSEEGPVGKIVDAQPAPSGGCDLLAVLQIDAAEHGKLHLNDTQGPGIKINKLPYHWADE